MLRHNFFSWETGVLLFLFRKKCIHAHKKKTILPIQDWLHKARIWWSPGVTHTHRVNGKMKKRISRNLWKLHEVKKSLVPPPATTKDKIKKDMCRKDGDWGHHPTLVCALLPQESIYPGGAGELTHISFSGWQAADKKTKLLIYPFSVFFFQPQNNDHCCN